jgi:polysaccharide export outer membrane protein
MKLLVVIVLLAVALAAQTGVEPIPLAPFDEVAIQALGAPEIDSQHFQIDERGSLRLPLAGDIEAAGLSPRELEERIEAGLGRFVRNPHALVTVVRYAERPVAIIGSVARPGVIQVNRPTTLLEALSSVGGLTVDAGPSVTLTRSAAWGPPSTEGASRNEEGKYVVRIPVAALLDGEDSQANILIRPNDVIVVSRANQVYVIGSVRRPGVFSAGEREGLSVLQAIALAGGLANHSSPKRSRILSQNVDGPWLDEVVDLKAMMAGLVPDRKLGSDEILYVPSSGVKATASQVGRAALSFGTGAAIWSTVR